MENIQKHEKIKWKCLHCEGIYTSDPNKRHQMDVCDCGKSGIDAEIYYTRIMGKVKFLDKNGKSK